jgi:hypothetical protein
MNEAEKQFSFTRAASITSGPAEKQIPISSVGMRRKLTTLFCGSTVRILVLLALLNAVLPAGAENLAPDSLASSLVSVTVAGGHAPFATNGTYRLFVSLAGTNYNVLGRAGPLTSGGCKYSSSGPNAGVASLVDDASGPGTSLTLAFASSTNGTLTLTNANGFQIGAFVLTSCAGTISPRLFLPGLAGGQFQTHLSGEPGFVYAIETSSDLVHWQPWLNVAVSDLTTNLSATAAQKACFYRARPASTAFAPASLTNQALSFTISEGKSPLSTHGICQWLGNTNSLGYKIISGPGTVNSSGNYSYTRTGPDSGLISCQDSVAGTLSQQLFFTSRQSGYFYTTNSTGYEAGAFSMADGPVLFLGHVKFVPDTARSSSLHFAANGSPATLSVTSADGWIWTLSFPADALLTPRVITMTPFTNVDAGNALLPVAAGVQLSPDGLQFSDGVTLTAKPPSPLGAHAALWMANDDGSAMYLVPSTNQATTHSTTLFHFSSCGVTDPSDPQWNTFRDNHLPQAQAAYQNAVTQCKSLTRVVTIPPEPPDYDWKCDPSGEDAQIDAYQQALFAKESDALRQLLAAARALELLGEVVNPNEFSIGLELIESAMFRKVDLLFSTYSGNPKKFVAVARISLGVMRQDQLLGGAGRPDWYQQLIAWGLRVVDYCLDQVRNEHKYSKASAVWQVARSAGLLGANISVDDLQDRVDKALRFKFTVDLNGTFKEWDSDGTIGTQVTEEAKGSATVQASTTLPIPMNTNYISVVSGSWADFLDECSYNLDPGQSSEWHIMMELQPCGKPPQVVFIFGGPYPPFETWTGCDQISLPSPWLGLIWDPAFACQRGGVFYFPLTDGESEIVNKTVPGDSSTGLCPDQFQRVTGTLQIQLEHKPE